MDTDTSNYRVTATPWSSGWELTLDDDNITSSRYLSDARQQVRDYLDTIQPNVDHSHSDIKIIQLLDTGVVRNNESVD